MRVNLTERAKGKWKDILTALNVESKFLTAKHGPCPMCGGKDRFRWDNKDGNGTYFCSACGAGNGISLLKAIHGWDFKTTAKKIESVLGGARRESPQAEVPEWKRREEMERLWHRANPVKANDPVDLWLRMRMGGRELVIPKSIRSHPDRPAMLAIMQGPDGKAATMHTTKLTEDGNKAPTDKVRLLAPVTIEPGSAVRLGTETEEMGVAEGIETAFAASILHGMPVWATLTEGMLSRWEPPACVKRLHVFGDHDRTFVGQAAAYALAKRLSLRPERAGGPIRCRVHIPDTVGDDWNDVLIRRLDKNVSRELTAAAG